MPEHTNALIEEKSPYLLQHAHNPVDWHAWNAETLALARAEDKPIFLSIGYSTCHWCHVMEHESFEDERTAALMNRYFINIKVDREERPDVDHTYMTAVQAMGQQGGWPLSAWLTPDLKFFYGGTYFPPASRFGRPGFPELIERIHDLWTGNREGLVGQAEEISGTIATVTRAGAPEEELTEKALDQGFITFRRMFDPAFGGFGQAPKFPRPVSLTFLLRYFNRTGNSDALAMVLQTLRHMALGGIHDHLGGGFSRYSVDAYWRVPHFEKMLYDQAQLLWAYSQAYQITGNEDIAGIIRDIAGYVRIDLTHPDGGFYSAEDADSRDADGVSREGAFYAWTLQELLSVLGERDGAVFAAYYGCTEAGNFEHGENVLHVSHTIPQVAEETGVMEDDVRTVLREGLVTLYRHRQSRQRPHLDDKVLTSWNGLMISALSAAYRALGDAEFLNAAQRAAEFVWSKLYDAQTRSLIRRYRDGDARISGFLDDHAFFALGLLDLYEASLEPEYLTRAVEIAGVMVDKFWDEDGGGFWFTANDDSSGMLRRKDDYDGAEPSGNSIAAQVLLRLAEMTGNTDWREKGERTIRAVSGIVMNYSETMPAMLSALDAMLTPPQQVVIAGDPKAEDTRAMLRAVQEKYLPNTTLLLATGDPALSEIAPWLAEMHPSVGKSAAYVCQNFACQAPTTGLETLKSALNPRPVPKA